MLELQAERGSVVWISEGERAVMVVHAMRASGILTEKGLSLWLYGSQRKWLKKGGCVDGRKEDCVGIPTVVGGG